MTMRVGERERERERERWKRNGMYNNKLNEEYKQVLNELVYMHSDMNE